MKIDIEEIRLFKLRPQDLIGPRAYFTTFDTKLLERVEWDLLRLEAERKLKVLLLTKREVLCAASHLASPLAYAILNENPSLLSSGALTPALREGRENVSEAVYAERGTSERSDEMAKFYDEHVNKIVSWPLEPNVEWYRAAMLRELADPISVLRMNLSQVTEVQIAEMRHVIAGTSKPLRDVMGTLAEAMVMEDRIAFLAFRELIYHMSGARVVNCESSLPQENFIDYGLADMEAHRTMLSDLQIFYKLFFEFVYQSIKGEAVAVQVLDLLSFDQVLEMREGVFDEKFAKDYDRMTQTVIRGITAKEIDHVLLDMNQLMEIREGLEARIRETVGNELDSFRKRRSIERGIAVVTPAAGIGATFIGVAAPQVALPAAGAALAGDSPEFLINLFKAISDDKARASLRRSIERKKKIAVDVISKIGGVERAMFMEAVTEVSNRAAEKLVI